MRNARWILSGLVIGFIGWPRPIDLVAHQPNHPQTGRSLPVVDQSDSTQSKSAASRKDTFRKPRPQIDAKRRRELLEFVRQNHPELESLVKSLRNKRPRQYEKAIAAIDKSVSSLQAIKESGRESRYDEVLENWKLNSRIQLLSAQLSIDDTPARRDQLSELIAKQYDDRLEQLRSDRVRAKTRLERLDTMITESKNNREADLKRRMEFIIASSQRIRKSRESQEKEKLNSKQGTPNSNRE